MVPHHQKLIFYEIKIITTIYVVVNPGTALRYLYAIRSGLLPSHGPYSHQGSPIIFITV